MVTGTAFLNCFECHVFRFQAVIAQQRILLWVLQEQTHRAVWHSSGGLLSSQQVWRDAAWAAREWWVIWWSQSQAQGDTARNSVQKRWHCSDINQNSSGWHNLIVNVNCLSTTLLPKLNLISHDCVLNIISSDDDELSFNGIRFVFII